MIHKQIYLDYAAATPMDPAVIAAMQPYLSERFHNPSATYLAAKAVAKDIESARSQVAHRLGSRPSEIVFTAGGTEANNLAIHGIMRSYPEANMVVSAVEHESVLKPASQYDCLYAKVQPDGRLNLSDLERQIDDKTVLVSIMYANNEIGTIEPIRQISAVLESINKDRKKRGIKLPLYFHTDACQAANYLDLHVSRFGVDMMTLNGGKIYGPKQSGILYVKSGLLLKPLISGGGQESGLRSGTENIAGIIGFSTALEIAQNMRHKEAKRLQELQDIFITELAKQIPSAVINGSIKHRLPNNIHITIPDQDNERLMMALDEAGIQCAVGSACSASSDEPSHVLRAIGLTDKEAQSSLRLTLGRPTTKPNIIQTIKTLSKLIK